MEPEGNGPKTAEDMKEIKFLFMFLMEVKVLILLVFNLKVKINNPSWTTVPTTISSAFGQWPPAASGQDTHTFWPL